LKRKPTISVESRASSACAEPTLFFTPRAARFREQRTRLGQEPGSALGRLLLRKRPKWVDRDT